jgi:hypothetical protein
MPTPVGVNGSFTAPTGHTLKFDRWQLNVGQRLINTTGFESAGYEENTGGLKFGQWLASGHFKDNASGSSPGFDALNGAGGSGTFQVATGCTVAATLIVANIEGTSDVNSEARGTLSGVTSGAITETWDETP